MEESKRHFPFVATLLFVVVLVGVLGFAWKVFSFYRQIQAGEVDPGTYGVTRTTSSVEAALAALVKNATGSGAHNRRRPHAWVTKSSGNHCGVR